MGMARLRKDRCVHEAGHAVAWWFFGHRFDSVMVNARKRVDFSPGGTAPVLGQVKGPPIVFERTSSEMGFADEEMRAWYRAKGIVRAEIQLVVIAAGPAAEATHGHRSGTGIWCFGGGAGDYAMAKAVARRWLDRDPEEAIDEAIVRAKALLRSDRGRRAVAALAQELARSASLDADAVDTICRGAFDGLEPAFQGWIEAWPPTLEDLQAGRVITQADEDAGSGGVATVPRNSCRAA